MKGFRRRRCWTRLFKKDFCRISVGEKYAVFVFLHCVSAFLLLLVLVTRSFVLCLFFVFFRVERIKTTRLLPKIETGPLIIAGKRLYQSRRFGPSVLRSSFPLSLSCLGSLFGLFGWRASVFFYQRHSLNRHDIYDILTIFGIVIYCYLEMQMERCFKGIVRK